MNVRKFLLFSALLSTSSTVLASYPESIFSADDQCRIRPTSNGNLYVPPCSFTPNRHYSDTSPTDSSNSMVRNGLFKTQLIYEFTCASIRPLSLTYELRGGSNSLSSGRISGSRTSEKIYVELTHEKSNANLFLGSLTGATGFQAIRPGCNMTIDQLVTYPEPRYFNLIASQLINYNSLISNLLHIATPSTNYISIISSMNNAITAFEMLQFDIDDEILLDQIGDSITQLTSSKSALSTSCSANSNSTLCSQAIANVRQYLNGTVSLNESNIRDMYYYLDGHVSWLNSYSLGRDYLILNTALNRLRTQL